MKSRAPFITCIALLLGMTACKKQEETQPPEPPTPKASEPTAAPDSAAPAQKAEEEGYITGAIGMRREPTNDKLVADRADSSGKRKVANFMSTLYRGEKVVVLGSQDAWTRIQSSDDKEGWIQSNGYLPASGVTTIAVMLDKAKTFERPSVANLRAGKELEPGAIVFVLKSKDGFSEVNVGTSSTWVKEDGYSGDKNEIAAAQLLQKVRALEKQKAGSAKEFIDMLRSEFGATKVAALLEPQPGDETPAAASAEPGRAPAPDEPAGARAAPSAPAAPAAPAAPPKPAPSGALPPPSPGDDE